MKYVELTCLLGGSVLSWSTIDSDSDFILGSDTDGTSEEEDAPHAMPPAVHPVSDREEDDMNDEDYSEIVSP
jgi:hypothetical protein